MDELINGFQPDYKFGGDLTLLGLKEDYNIEFNGCGWYVCEGDYMLIAQWDFDNYDLPLYQVYVWNGRDPRQAFKQMINAPVHTP